MNPDFAIFCICIVAIIAIVRGQHPSGSLETKGYKAGFSTIPGEGAPHSEPHQPKPKLPRVPPSAKKRPVKKVRSG